MTRHYCSGDLEIVGRRQGCWQASLHHTSSINYTYPISQLLRIYPATTQFGTPHKPLPPQPPALRPVKCAHRTNRACIRRTAPFYTGTRPCILCPTPSSTYFIIHTYCPSPFYPICAPWIRFSCQPRTPPVASHLPTQLVDAPYSSRFIQSIIHRRVSLNLFFPQSTIPVSLSFVFCHPFYSVWLWLGPQEIWGLMGIRWGVMRFQPHYPHLSSLGIMKGERKKAPPDSICELLGYRPSQPTLNCSRVARFGHQPDIRAPHQDPASPGGAPNLFAFCNSAIYQPTLLFSFHLAVIFLYAVVANDLSGLSSGGGYMFSGQHEGMAKLAEHENAKIGSLTVEAPSKSHLTFFPSSCCYD